VNAAKPLPHRHVAEGEAATSAERRLQRRDAVEMWMSKEELLNRTGWSIGRRDGGRSKITRACRRGELICRKSERRGRNGKAAEYRFRVEASAATVAIPESSEEHKLPLFATAPQERVAIPEELRPQADARFRAIEPLLKFREEKRPAFAKSDGRVIRRLADLAEYIAAQQQPAVSARTIFRWMDRWDEARKRGDNGYLALVRTLRCDAKGAGSKALNAIAQAYVQKKYLDKNEGELSAYMAWEALKRDWRSELGQNGKAPSYSAVLRYLNTKLGFGVKILARKGPEALLSLATPFIVRSKCLPMQTWVSDHRVHDVAVRNRMFVLKAEELDKEYRVWLTAIFDQGSQAIVGYCFSPQPNWRTIHSAIRMAATRYGLPREFYWDNGEDFKKAKRQLQRFDPSPEVLSLNFRVTSAIPKHPRSKPIEAYFTRFAKRFDPMWGDAYLGNSPKNRREHARVAEYLHKRFVEGKASSSPLQADVEFIACGIQWIEEYNNKPLPQLHGRTPLQVMEEAWPEASRPKLNPRALDILLWEPKVCIVGKGGAVRMDSITYEPTDEYLYVISNLQGQGVHVLRDPYNLGEAIVVSEDRRFLGELRPKEFVLQDASNPITRDQIQARMKEQRRFAKMHSQHLAILSLISDRLGWRTEREMLWERARTALGMTGTDGGRALPAAAAPGAAHGVARSARPARAIQPAFVSDAVAQDEGIFNDVIEGRNG